MMENTNSTHVHTDATGRGSPICSIALLPSSLSGLSQQAQNATAKDQHSCEQNGWMIRVE